MQSEGTLDLFFFQEYKWFRNKIWAQAHGLNGYLLTSVNEWPAREGEGHRDRRGESGAGGRAEKQALRRNMLFPACGVHTHPHVSDFTA